MSESSGQGSTRGPTIDEVTDDYVDRSAALDPVSATYNGVTGHDTELTDFSPDAEQARADLARQTLADLADVDAASDRDRRGVRVLRERLEIALDLHQTRDHLRNVSTLFGPLQQVRGVFDLMPTSTAEDWAALADRLEQVPWSLATARESLAAGLDIGLHGSSRLALVVAEQAESWAGASGTPGFFDSLVAPVTAPDGTEAPAVSHDVADRLASAAGQAGRACAIHAAFLRKQYAPQASSATGVGADRYAIHARAWTGDDIDLLETYEWGWHELARLLRAMQDVGERILPGAPLPAVIEHVKTLPGYVIEGPQELRRWLQDLMDSTIDSLDGTHFDIPDQIRRVEAMIAPPGGAAAMYYTPPSEDFSRPGRTWYPTQGRTTFPLWLEKAICYHEGVPGHHLEVGGVKTRPDLATRYQRLVYIAGYSEGWALYAERLMGELGYLDDPVYELGALATSAMRAARVVIDLGLHLGLRVPDDPGFSADWLVPGSVMTPEAALEIAVNVAPFPREFMASEIDRYLGMPGQAISYKVGERVWLDTREQARTRHGSAFDLKSFHTHALSMGSLGLAQLRDEMARW